MSEVTHGKCPACRSYEPIIWNRIHIEEVHVDGKVGVFDGMDARCRRCDFEIASLGTILEKVIA
jgi:hypothetical protein